MPGLSLVLHHDVHRSAHDRARQLLSSRWRPRHHRVETLVESGSASLTVTTYDGYPLDHWEDEEYRYFFEGHLYGLNQEKSRKELERVGRFAFSARTRLEHWVREIDGEFLFVCEEKASGQWRVVNDLLGRLPTYLHEGPLGLVLSRDVRFAVRAMDHTRIDRLALAQYFLLGSCLSDATPWKGVRYLPAASILSIAPGHPMRLERLHRLDVSHKDLASDIDANAEQLASLFRDACHHRAAVARTPIVALSGGFDSRAVAAGLTREGVPFESVTMSGRARFSDEEVQVARRTAQILGAEWHEFTLEPSDGRAYLELLNLKNGLNELGMAFHLPFFHDVQERFGPGAVYFTGDGGDKAMPDLRPYTSFHDDREVAHYVVDRSSVFGLEDSARLAGIAPERLFGSLLHAISTYPGETGVEKYVHFVLLQRSMKWLFEGEDRNRAFFWSTTPFYSMPFFHAAMRCPDDHKHRYDLYLRMLSLLYPELDGLPKVGHPGEPGTLRFDAAHVGRLMLQAKPRLSRRMQRLMQGVNGFSRDAEIVRLIRHQLARCGSIGDVLDSGTVQRIIENPERHSKHRLTSLATVTSMLEGLNGGTSLGNWSGMSLS